MELREITAASEITDADSFVGVSSGTTDYLYPASALASYLAPSFVTNPNTAPTVVAGPAAGGAGSSVATISGNDRSFTFSIAIGSSPTPDAILAVITYGHPIGHTPSISLIPVGKNSSGLDNTQQVYISAFDSTHAVISARTSTLGVGSTYTFTLLSF